MRILGSPEHLCKEQGLDKIDQPKNRKKCQDSRIMTPRIPPWGKLSEGHLAHTTFTNTLNDSQGQRNKLHYGCPPMSNSKNKMTLV